MLLLLNLSVSATRGGPDFWEQMVTIGKEQHQEFSQLIMGSLQTSSPSMVGWEVGAAGVEQDRAASFLTEGEMTTSPQKDGG